MTIFASYVEAYEKIVLSPDLPHIRCQITSITMHSPELAELTAPEQALYPKQVYMYIIILICRLFAGIQRRIGNLDKTAFVQLDIPG